MALATVSVTSSVSATLLRGLLGLHATTCHRHTHIYLWCCLVGSSALVATTFVVQIFATGVTLNITATEVWRRQSWCGRVWL